MAFIRTRKGKHFDSNQLIETYREGDKVKQHIIGNLRQFNNVPDAIAFWKRHIEASERMLAAKEKHLEVAQAQVKKWRAQDEDWHKKHGRPFYERPPEHRGVEFKWPRYFYADDEEKALKSLNELQAEREAAYLEMGLMFGLQKQQADIERFRKSCVEETITIKVTATYRQLVADIAFDRKRIAAERANLAALEDYQNAKLAA
ncbi:MAG: hypothetical protein WBX25_35690 [Rhodomicrobium sp.]